MGLEILTFFVLIIGTFIYPEYRSKRDERKKILFEAASYLKKTQVFPGARDLEKIAKDVSEFDLVLSRRLTKFSKFSGPSKKDCVKKHIKIPGKGILFECEHCLDNKQYKDKESEILLKDIISQTKKIWL